MTTTMDVETARTIAREADRAEQEQVVNDLGDALRDQGFTVEGRAGDVRRGATRVRRTPEEVAANSLYPVPSEAALDGEFTPAPDLERIADALIERHHHRVASEATIIYLWRDKAWKAKGKVVFGKCQKPTGLLKHFAAADVVIALAADALRDMGATYRQIEAALWHELCHVGETEEPDDSKEDWVPELTILPHDFEGFATELTLFGDWRSDLTTAVHAVRQMKLDLDGTDV